MQEKEDSHQGVQETLTDITIQIAEKGHGAAYKYLVAVLNKWKEEKVTIAVTGTSGIGKSTFINEVRGVKLGEKGFAKQGRGNTTKKPTTYTHPRNDQISFCDLPGAGTLQFPRANYCKDMKLGQYDIFLIFLGLDLTEEDEWLAKTLHDIDKPFCFVRSKIDEDMQHAKQDGNNPDEMIEDIRKKIEAGIQSNEILKESTHLFLISNYDKTIGEWEKLVSFIEGNLSVVKKEALLYSLPNFTTDIINKKCLQLKSRLKWVTAGCSLISILPFVDCFINKKIVASELRHYIEVFGLRLDEMRKINGFDASKLKCRTILDPNSDLEQLIANELSPDSLAAKMAEKIPVVGSVVSAYNTADKVSIYLDDVIEDFRHDSSLAYEHLIEIEGQKKWGL